MQVIPPAPRTTPEARILLVDSDASVRDALAGTLSGFGYQTDTAATKGGALALLRQQAYSVVLADLALPDTDSLDLADTIALRHPDVPIVLLAGRDQIEAARQALRRGAADVVTKPVAVHALPLVIERNLERRRIEFEKIAIRSEEVLLAAIDALAAAIDAKEMHTGQHSRRVAALSLWLGEPLDLSPAEKRLLELSAYMHDVGKIGTPDRILNKPGPLSAAERRIIQQHPVKGSEILSQIPDLVFVASVVRHHHERMDGGGYPDGLAGPAIPLFSRVISVTDAFEAMTSSRAYRRGMPVPEAVAQLRANAGTQFDPRIVRLFLDRLHSPDALPPPVTVPGIS